LTADGRWRSALIALVALGWATATRFVARDRWSIVIIFAVLSVALWWRSIKYAYRVARMTVAERS